MKIIIEYGIIESEKDKEKSEKPERENQMKADIEIVNHIYSKDYTFDYYSVFYSSGRIRTYASYEKLPKTVKAFIKCHYDEIVEKTYSIVYKYRAINIIK